MNRIETLKNAKQIVCDGREKEYGSPENNFNLIAKLWSAYTGHSIRAVDVAMMLALLKIARVSTGMYKPDNFIDLAGYAACGAEVGNGQDGD